MLIDAQYKRDLHGHYLVISSEDKKLTFGLKMLLNNKIKGLLNLELHIIDNVNQYYYDITAKQSFTYALEKGQLKYNQVKSIIKDVIKAIDTGKDYLLSENDFVLHPDYLYINVATLEVSLCYLVGYEEDIIKQLNGIIEYLMNKVDYTDEQAVLLIYGLYKISREEYCTFNSLLEFIDKKVSKEDQKNYEMQRNNELQRNNEMQQNNEDYQNNEEQQNKKEQKNNKVYQSKVERPSICENDKKNIQAKKRSDKSGVGVKIPMMQERIQSEEEILVYSKATIIVAVISSFVCVLIFAIGYNLKIFHDSLELHIDILKLFGAFLMIGTLEAYILSKLFHKKNKITKIKGKVDYINNVITLEGHNKIEFNKGKESENKFIKEQGNKTNEDDKVNLNSKFSPNYKINQGNKINQEYLSKQDYQTNQDRQIEKGNKTEFLNYFDSGQTTLLSIETQEDTYKLSSSSPMEYKDIEIIEFPFFIGKLHNKIDSTIESNVISRYHAKIEQKNGEFFITDLNSTNGTFLNSSRLNANESKKLHIQDELIFANLSYHFEMT